MSLARRTASAWLCLSSISVVERPLLSSTFVILFSFWLYGGVETGESSKFVVAAIAGDTSVGEEMCAGWDSAFWIVIEVLEDDDGWYEIDSFSATTGLFLSVGLVLVSSSVAIVVFPSVIRSLSSTDE